MVEKQVKIFFFLSTKLLLDNLGKWFKKSLPRQLELPAIVDRTSVNEKTKSGPPKEWPLRIRFSCTFLSPITSNETGRGDNVSRSFISADRLCNFPPLISTVIYTGCCLCRYELVTTSKFLCFKIIRDVES